jgi:hypothetical protein
LLNLFDRFVNCVCIFELTPDKYDKSVGVIDVEFTYKLPLRFKLFPELIVIASNVLDPVNELLPLSDA